MATPHRCHISSSTPTILTVAPTDSQPTNVRTESTFETGVYPNLFENCLADEYPNSTLSVGLRLNDSLNIADKQIDALLDTSIVYNCPVFIHLRGGSDDAPDLHIAAWNRFRETLQAEGGIIAALVWEAASSEESNIACFYPGEESVDWIGTNYRCAEEKAVYWTLTSSNKGRPRPKAHSGSEQNPICFVSQVLKDGRRLDPSSIE